jgi:hypothetical protein
MGTSPGITCIDLLEQIELAAGCLFAELKLTFTNYLTDENFSGAFIAIKTEAWRPIRFSIKCVAVFG